MITLPFHDWRNMKETIILCDWNKYQNDNWKLLYLLCWLRNSTNCEINIEKGTFTWKLHTILFLWQHDNRDSCNGYDLKTEPKGGFYIMHSIAQNGQKANNRKFSDCSLDHMGAILSQEKRTKCFKSECRIEQLTSVS